ncbi:MAG TPA: hypothetical protein EYP59_10140 [Thiotrichaceae bacterium]|nr:hypothetical protein [Thiotrichaceae bacterium]
MKLEIENETGNISVEINSDYPDEVMRPYIEKLAEWAWKTWDYEAVAEWLPSEFGGKSGGDMYLIAHTNEGYFKIHYPDLDDFEGLFSQKYADAPEPLAGWEDKNIYIEISWPITKNEYAQLKEKYESNL